MPEGSRAATSSRILDYVESVLTLHPAADASSILRHREQFHGIDSENRRASHSFERALEDRATRELTRQALEKIRGRVWHLSPEELNEALAGLGLERFPDLEHVAARLKTLSKGRDVLAEIAATW